MKFVSLLSELTKQPRCPICQAVDIEIVTFNKKKNAKEYLGKCNRCNYRPAYFGVKVRV